ncbi:hypothetical protein ACI65C_004684 [Semiaphis heraclei]
MGRPSKVFLSTFLPYCEEQVQSGDQKSLPENETLAPTTVPASCCWYAYLYNIIMISLFKRQRSFPTERGTVVLLRWQFCRNSGSPPSTVVSAGGGSEANEQRPTRRRVDDRPTSVRRRRRRFTLVRNRERVEIEFFLYHVLSRRLTRDKYQSDNARARASPPAAPSDGRDVSRLRGPVRTTAVHATFVCTTTGPPRSTTAACAVQRTADAATASAAAAAEEDDDDDGRKARPPQCRLPHGRFRDIGYWVSVSQSPKLTCTGNEPYLSVIPLLLVRTERQWRCAGPAF